MYIKWPANAQLQRKSIEWETARKALDVAAVGWAHVIESDNAHSAGKESDVR